MPEGKRRRGKPKGNWRRTIETDTNTANLTMNEVEMRLRIGIDGEPLLQPYVPWRNEELVQGQVHPYYFSRNIRLDPKLLLF